MFLNFFLAKTKDGEFINSPGALDVVVDMLFIMRRICSCTKAKGQQGGAQADGGNEDGVMEEDPPPPPPSQQEQSAGETAPARGRGRSANKRNMGEEPVCIFTLSILA